MNKNVNTWALPDGAIARLGRGCVRDLALSPDRKTLVRCHLYGGMVV